MQLCVWSDCVCNILEINIKTVPSPYQVRINSDPSPTTVGDGSVMVPFWYRHDAFLSPPEGGVWEMLNFFCYGIVY